MLTNNYNLREVKSKLQNVIKNRIVTIRHMWQTPEEIAPKNKMLSLAQTYPTEAIFYDMKTIYKTDWRNFYRLIKFHKNTIIFYKTKDNYIIIKDKKIVVDKAKDPVTFIKRILFSVNNPINFRITTEEIWFKDYLTQTHREKKFQTYAKFCTEKPNRFKKLLDIITSRLQLIDQEILHSDFYDEDKDYIQYKKESKNYKQLFFYKLQLIFYLKDSQDIEMIKKFADEQKAQTFQEAVFKLMNWKIKLEDIIDETKDLEVLTDPNRIDFLRGDIKL